jgi:cyclophilin family peptidyl-prolyl cis-trans isomerase
MRGVRLRASLAAGILVTTLVSLPVGAQRAGASPDPVMTIETAKGAIAIRLFRTEAPKSIEKILALVKRNFYRGQRIHRVENSLVQFGDPSSRDVSRKDWWGRTGSGQAVGVAEFSKRTHVRGAVGLAHGGDARYADSQIYILKAASPSLNGKHVVIGQVIKGIEVVDKLQVADVLKNVTVTEAAPK